MPKKNTLGSIIDNLKYRDKKTRSTSNRDYQHDITTVIKRLEGYKKYQMQLVKEKKLIKQKERRKLEKQFRREVRKRIYKGTYTPNTSVYNPYLNMSKMMTTGVDPKLLERYKTRNAYSFTEFRHAKLPKTNFQINAGQAWYGLERAWTGFYTSRRLKDSKRTILYASAVQKYCDILDLTIPDFPTIGLSREGYSSAKILKQFLNVNEIVGDEPI